MDKPVEALASLTFKDVATCRKLLFMHSSYLDWHYNAQMSQCQGSAGIPPALQCSEIPLSKESASLLVKVKQSASFNLPTVIARAAVLRASFLFTT
eukprot:1161606-Pelagomonas_calceolata.AAC.7